MEKDEESQLVCLQSPQLSVSELATPSDDEDTAPIPPAQIAASYERIDDIEAGIDKTRGIPEVKYDREDTAPIPPAQADLEEDANKNLVNLKYDREDTAPIPIPETYLDVEQVSTDTAPPAIELTEEQLEIRERMQNLIEQKSRAQASAMQSNAHTEEGPLDIYLDTDTERISHEDEAVPNTAASSNQIQREKNEANARDDVTNIERMGAPITTNDDATNVEINVDTTDTPNELLPHTTERETAVEPARLESDNQLEQDGDGNVIVPEAYLVTSSHHGSDMIIDGYAEPLLPWWKQRRTKLLFSVICILVITAAVAIGVATRDGLVVVESLAPSISFVPTAAPTACELKVSNQKQTLDLYVENAHSPRIVMDGNNALVVTQGIEAGSPFHVIFYKYSDSGWERVTNFIEEDATKLYGTLSSAISGNTALVGLWKEGDDDAGLVLVYNQDELGLWTKSNEPILRENPENPESNVTYFGRVVDIDGDMVCVTSIDEGAVYMYIQDKGKWTQVDKIIPPLIDLLVEKCFIVDNTVVVHTYIDDSSSNNIYIFKYDGDINKFTPLQDALLIDTPRLEIGLTNNHLVYSTCSTEDGSDCIYDGVFIYERQRYDDPFTFLQLLNSTTYDTMFGAKLGIDKDLLTIYAFDETIVFSIQDGYWQESLRLNRPYERYQVSDRNILGTGAVFTTDEKFPIGYEVHAYSVEDCVQSIPTQMPSFSTAPTTTSSSVSCETVDITLKFDSFPGNTSWKLTKLKGSNNDVEEVEVESYAGSWYDINQAKTWSVCLQEGQYSFTIYDNEGDGISGFGGEGSYNVTFIPSKEVIANGGVFAYSETTQFSIPFAYTKPDNNP